MLRKWVEHKYRLPLTHSSFRDLTPFELLVWYWEDYYDKNPIEAKRVAGGKEVKFVTGDPILDKWEAEIAAGLEPDLMEGLSPEERDKEKASLERLLLQEQKKQKAKQAGDGFSDDYSNLSSDLSKLNILGR